MSRAIASSAEIRPRFHSFDALRAVAMLGGILLHAVWMYTPADTRAPVVDASAHGGPSYLLFLIHGFRMQAFFLIAGFFAHLVISRRGTRAFMRQRMKRIGIPLIVGWAFMFPLIRACYQWGAITMGADINGRTPWEQVAFTFTNGAAFSKAFSWTHLWFLYVLLLVSAATVIVGWISRRPRVASLNRTLELALVNTLQSRWSVPILAAITALFLWRLSWGGVDTPRKAIPHFGSFMIYWLFFLVGWVLYKNLQLLKVIDRRWKMAAVVGLTLSLPIFFFNQSQSDQGRLTYHKVYPYLTGGEIQDWVGLRTELLASEHEDSPASTYQKVWNALPAPLQVLVRETPQLNYKQETALAMALNRFVLLRPALFANGGGAASPKEAALFNRKHLETAFADQIAAGTLDKPFYQWGKVVHAFLYAIMSWSLVFASLGFFRCYFSRPSATWRYVADSSYWMYLAHLPLLFVLEIPMAQVEAHWVLKLALLNVSAFVILLVSYHYLVRSTFIGACLNGRRLPRCRLQISARTGVRLVPGEA